MMKRLVLVCALGGLVLSACSPSNDPASDTTVESNTESSVGSVVAIPGIDIVITDEQAATLVGKTEAEAEAYAHDSGWAWRVGRRDGEQFALTMDYSEGRVTVSIDGLVVTEVVVG